MKTIVRMSTLFVLAALAAAVAPAQDTAWRYVAARDATTVTASVVTVQQPATLARNVQFEQAIVCSSTAGSFTVERNGTAASSTALTVALLSSVNPAVKATAWHTSNVGAGTVISGTVLVAAGTCATYDMSGIRLIGSGTTKNVTVRGALASGNMHITVRFREYN